MIPSIACIILVVSLIATLAVMFKFLPTDALGPILFAVIIALLLQCFHK